MNESIFILYEFRLQMVAFHIKFFWIFHGCVFKNEFLHDLNLNILLNFQKKTYTYDCPLFVYVLNEDEKRSVTSIQVDTKRLIKS